MGNTVFKLLLSWSNHLCRLIQNMFHTKISYQYNTQNQSSAIWCLKPPQTTPACCELTTYKFETALEWLNKTVWIRFLEPLWVDNEWTSNRRHLILQIVAHCIKCFRINVFFSSCYDRHERGSSSRCDEICENTPHPNYRFLNYLRKLSERDRMADCRRFLSHFCKMVLYLPVLVSSIEAKCCAGLSRTIHS